MSSLTTDINISTCTLRSILSRKDESGTTDAASIPIDQLEAHRKPINYRVIT